MAKLEKFNLPQYGSFTTDAAMQEFFVAYTNFFEANGFVRTSDTGQFDPATAAGTGTFYEVRKFTGTHASTSPIFVKFSFTNRNQTNTITFGTGSDGSGNITGTWLTAAGSNSMTGSYGTGGLLLATVPGEFVTFSFYAYSGTSFHNGYAFTVGRSINANTGNVTGDMAYVMGGKKASSLTSQPWFGARDYTVGAGYSTTTTANAYFDLGISASPKAIEVILLRRAWFNITTPSPFPHSIAGFTSEWPVGSQTSLTNVGPNTMTFRTLGEHNNSNVFLGRWD